MGFSIIKTKSQAELIISLCNQIESTAREAIADRGKFIIGLSGGSLVDFLCSGLPAITTDWSKWKFLFCDERIVPEDSADSTFGIYKTKLLPQIGVTENQFVKINNALSAAECAESYCSKMKTIFEEDKLPKFDMLLLGMGPDGHTCSLFPKHLALSEDKKWVIGIEDSPKPPPQRITLTFPVINNARSCIFALCGKGKAEMVKRILEDKEDLPAGRVKCQGETFWILDNEAASLLKL